MSRFTQLKEKLATVAPFVTYDIYGKSNAFAVKKDGLVYPMTVSCMPPDMGFLLESGLITTMILRYSKTYREHLKAHEGEIHLPEAEKNQFVSEAMKEIREEATTEDGQLKMMSLIMKCGRAYVFAKCLKAWYTIPDEKEEPIRAVWFETKEECDTYNNANDPNVSMAFWLEMLTDMEQFNFGSKLTTVLEETDDLENLLEIPNIPLETAEGGVITVPATDTAKFPISTRNLVVENLPKPSSGEVTDHR